MNDLIRELADQAIAHANQTWNPDSEPERFVLIAMQKHAELIKQAIYDEVKEELIPDELVDIEPDSLSRQYLKGCNGGVTDALYIIKNFGVIQDDE